jgi:hypothetical protein
MKILLRSAVCLVAVSLASMTSAWACGGFFHDLDAVESVDQSGERILFDVHDDGRMSVYLEVSYTGQPESFAWILPTPETMSTDDLGTVPAEFFDELEQATAPRFVFPSSDDRRMSCGCLGAAGGDGNFRQDEGPGGVEVLGEAVVGHFAIQIIVASDLEGFMSWLDTNGYGSPPGAEGPLAHYIDNNFAFIGVQLVPEVPDGPIEGLVLHMNMGAPMVPIRLARIASVPLMPVLVYVLAEGPFRPDSYAELDFDYGQVRYDFDVGGTDYVTRLQSALGEIPDHHAFVTEFSGGTDRILGELADLGNAAYDVVSTKGYLSRFRTYLSPAHMNLDPTWREAPGAPEVSNHHIGSDPDEEASLPSNPSAHGLAFAALPWMVLAVWMRRDP